MSIRDPGSPVPLRWSVALLGLVVLGVALGARGGPIEARPWLVIGALVLAGIVWTVCVRLAAGGAISVGLALGGTLLVRLAAWGADPGLSDDVYRYVWEGELVLRGRNPYAAAPADPALADVARALAETRARINHPDVPAAYPPATQLFCAAGVALGRVLPPPVVGGDATADERGRAGVRIVFAVCDLLVLLPLAALLVALGRPLGLLVAWGWCPLAAVELGAMAHFDALAILLLTAALALLPRAAVTAPRALAGGAALGAAVLAKLLPIALAPFLLRSRWRVAGFTLALATLAAPFVLVLEPASLGGGGIGAYAFKWESTSLVYRFVEAPLERLWELDESRTDPRRIGRAIVGGVWLFALVWLLAKKTEPWRAGRVLIGLFLVLSPTLHPWYVCWILPFLALAPGAAWCWLAAAAPLLYAPLAGYRATGQWIEPAWLWPAVALPFFALLALPLMRAAEADGISPGRPTRP